MDHLGFEEEEKKERPISGRRRVGKKVSTTSIKRNAAKDDQDQKTPEEDSQVVATVPAQGWGFANGIFKEAFEEIVTELVSLSHYCTNSYRSYKQNATMTDHKLDELKRNFTDLS